MLERSGPGHREGNLKRGIGVILAWLLAACGAFPQGAGVLEGRLVNGTDPAAAPAGVALEVVAPDGGMRIIRTAETDRTGAFRIEGLPEEPMLLVRAVYGGAPYQQHVRFDASGHARAELEVFEATRSAEGIRLEEMQMVFQAAGGHLELLETGVFSNETRPPRTFADPSGTVRFSKAPGIEQVPQIRVTAPGAAVPVVGSVLESPDGRSYYSLYPLRPGRTTVDVFQKLPYPDRKYAYARTFFHPVPSIEIGVIPMDVELAGTGLVRVHEDPGKNIAVYRIGPVAAGTEVQWVFSGGGQDAAGGGGAEQEAGGTRIRAVPNAVSGYAGVIAPLLLLGFLIVLWYASNRLPDDGAPGPGGGTRLIKQRRELLLDRVADLDRRREAQAVGDREYRRRRREGVDELRRISLHLK